MLSVYSLAVSIAIEISLITSIMIGLALPSIVFRQASLIISAPASKDFLSKYYASSKILLPHPSFSVSIANVSSIPFLLIF